MPALSAEGASGKLSTQGCREKQRIQADRHSITYCNDSNSLLTRPRNKKLDGCICLSLCCCDQKAHPSQTQTEGQTDSAQLSGIQLWTLVWLIVKSSSSSLCLGARQPKNRALRGAQALRPLNCLSMGRHIFQLCTRGKGIRGLIPA